MNCLMAWATRIAVIACAWYLSGAEPAVFAQAAANEQAATELPPGARPTLTSESADAEAAYTRVITERADKIVAQLDLTDKEQATRVRDLIAQEYRSLRDIHDALEAKITETQSTPGADPTLVSAWVGVARAQASIKLLYLHRYFVARLAAELSPEQVNQVKDGMTYGVVQVTYNRYLQLLPQLTDEQKREVLANLVEARDYAMDAGSSEEKHAIFGKYKGRINNYLSAAGYNLNQAERDLAARERARREGNAQQ
jgi:hypothetical protein